MPHKDMREFLRDFFNPPQLMKPKGSKKKIYKKRKKKTGPTPIQLQLAEANEYMKFNMTEFERCETGWERVQVVYGAIPDEATTIDRLWPTQLTNKDSRVRRELSARGQECFHYKDFDDALVAYNEATTFSSGKGLAHTLARRAGFLLQTQEHMLALRDLHLALHYGCLENELLDGLLEHHNCGNDVDLRVGEKWEKKYVSRYDPCRDKSPWIAKIRKVLDEFDQIKRLTNANESKKAKFKKLDEIIEIVKEASEELDFSRNFESKTIEVPKISKPNPLFPSLTSLVDVSRDLDKGRHLVANDDIPVGEIIVISDPIASLLCPENLDKLQNHCLHCHLFSKAPIPCETCCAVVFCSLKCRREAGEYHKYECEMRLYELIPLEGKEMFGYFLALRAITQRPLQYFLDNKEMFEEFYDLDEPKNIEQDTVYLDEDYRNLMNLMTHINDMSDSLTLKNSIISVFFLRFLQHGKYFQPQVPEKKEGDRRLHPSEEFILKLLHHLIAVQCFNSSQVTELAVVKAKYKWEVIGSSLHPTVALVNHSCDPNTFRFNMNQTCILIANRHIKRGEEITMAYSVDFKTMKLAEREFHLLKTYMFQCECRACLEKWPLKEALPDELARIPNFEQEKCFVVRYGDKKDICDEINGARWMADFGLASNTFNVAQEALDLLSVCLHKHVVKPHLHFVEASEMAEMFAINQYCRMPLETAEEEVKKGVEEVDDNSDGENEAKRKISNVVCKASEGLERIQDRPDTLEGTTKLIKSFESGATGAQRTKARDLRSPTLRMFSSAEEQTSSGKGPKKRSVLERLDEKKFKPSSESSKAGTEKSKRDLADSMRRIPVKEEMAERLSAFQPKNLVPKSWIKQSDKNTEVLKDKTEEENNNDKKEEIKTAKSNRNSVYEFLDNLKDSLTGEKKVKTDEEINDEISKLIDLKRKNIREERRRGRQEKENRPPSILEPRYEALEVKDLECKKEITRGELKLNKMIENSKEREQMLHDRELEIQMLRERTKRMLENAKKKNDEFQKSEKAALKDGDHPNNSDTKTSKKSKAGQKSSKNTKYEFKKKNASSSNDEDDKDLIAFLRQSHKNKTNIYNFMEKKNDDITEVRNTLNINSPSPSRKNGIHNHDNDIENSLKLCNDVVESVQQTANNHQNYKPRLRDTLEILPKRKHVEDRWEDTKKKTIPEIHSDPEPTAAPPLLNLETIPRLEVVETNNPCIMRETAEDFDQVEVNGKHWVLEVEESEPETVEMVHYSQRRSVSRSASRSPRTRRSHQPVTLSPPPPETPARPPRPGRLSRRKSLSEDNLLPKRRQEAVSQEGTDAFGLPRISVKSRRSVSLMRDTFLSKKDSEAPPPSQTQGRQRSISKETQTSNASEFKAKFENGSVSNLSKVSRANSPYKPPKVDRTHLTKVKTKFNDISTDNLKLPFPNFRPIPPRPKCRPPPPPPL